MLASSMERLVSLLGGWPEQFSDVEVAHGESLLALLRRERLIDEVAFGMVVRYARHRAAYDRLSFEIAQEEFEATASQYLSGKEQSRAFHENKLLTIERELLATPYARAKSGGNTQTSFMDVLANLDDTASASGADKASEKTNAPRKVTPFRPIGKKTYGS